MTTKAPAHVTRTFNSPTDIFLAFKEIKPKPRQSKEGKKKQEYQLYLAREDPEPVFDISECELSEVPTGVYSLCKVLRKETLILRNNYLTSIRGGGNYKDLYLIQVLDLSENWFTFVPEEVGSFPNLRALNLRNNKIRKLPDSIKNLTKLQQINLRHNKLKEFPKVLCDLPTLEAVDLTKNSHVRSLPTEFARCAGTMKKLVIDTYAMRHPDPIICEEGTAAIMKFLCKEHGVDYEAPSDATTPTSCYSLDSYAVRKQGIPAGGFFAPGFVGQPPFKEELPRAPVRELGELQQQLEMEGGSDELKNRLKLDQTVIAETQFEERRRDYESNKHMRNQERLLAEKQIHEMLEQEMHIVAEIKAKKAYLLDEVAEEQVKLQGDLDVIYQKREADRRRLLVSVKEADEEVNSLLRQILDLNERAEEFEEILDAHERYRAEEEKLFEVSHEEVLHLRQKEVLESMSDHLEQYSEAQLLAAFERYEKKKEEVRDRAVAEIATRQDAVDSILQTKWRSRDEMLKEFMEEVEFQREAYEQLVLEKDVKHERLRTEITLIEQELKRLTALELDRKLVKAEQDKVILAEHRDMLMRVMYQLVEEKTSREEELKKRLYEMEDHREDTVAFYWLVQYQRLMDRKPQALIDKEHQLEYAVLNILQDAGADDYIPLFARHRITIESMVQLTDEELQQMGVHQMGIRAQLLKNIDTTKEEMERAKQKVKELESSAYKSAIAQGLLSAGKAGPSTSIIPSAPSDAKLMSPDAEPQSHPGLDFPDAAHPVAEEDSHKKNGGLGTKNGSARRHSKDDRDTPNGGFGAPSSD